MFSQFLLVLLISQCAHLLEEERSTARMMKKQQQGAILCYRMELCFKRDDKGVRSLNELHNAIGYTVVFEVAPSTFVLWIVISDLFNNLQSMPTHFVNKEVTCNHFGNDVLLRTKTSCLLVWPRAEVPSQDVRCNCARSSLHNCSSARG
jgi:hypothetical protein